MLPPNQIRLIEALLAARYVSQQPSVDHVHHARYVARVLEDAFCPHLAACYQHWTLSGPTTCMLAFLAIVNAADMEYSVNAQRLDVRDDVDGSRIRFWERHGAT